MILKSISSFNAEAYPALGLWHHFVETHDMRALYKILADDITFHAPLYMKERRGKAEVCRLMAAAVSIFEDFQYRRLWVEEKDWALEFSAKIGEFELKGIDLISLDDKDQIIRFEVMLRPLNALLTMRNRMEKLMAATRV